MPAVSQRAHTCARLRQGSTSPSAQQQQLRSSYQAGEPHMQALRQGITCPQRSKSSCALATGQGTPHLRALRQGRTSSSARLARLASWRV